MVLRGPSTAQHSTAEHSTGQCGTNDTAQAPSPPSEPPHLSHVLEPLAQQRGLVGLVEHNEGACAGGGTGAARKGIGRGVGRDQAGDVDDAAMLAWFQAGCIGRAAKGIPNQVMEGRPCGLLLLSCCEAHHTRPY